MAEPEFTTPRGCRLTQSNDGKRLYIHLLDYPNGFLQIPELYGKVDYAQFLHDGSELRFSEGNFSHMGDVISNQQSCFTIQIPAIQPDVLVPVIEIFLK